MANASIDFEAPDLAARAERASLFEIDHLPFGVIRMARDGTVQFYSATEARLSGYGEIPLGRNLFDISNCFGSEAFRGRIERALDTGPIDLEIGWPGDFGDPRRELRIRVQSSRNGGLWLFIERDDAPLKIAS
jgi:photoactive yellow protein